MEAEYAYVDVKVKGNSRVAVYYLEAIRDIVEKLEIKELAFQSDGYSAVLLREPVTIFVRVKGDISDAKLHARRVLKELGYLREDNLEEVFKLAEKIENMPIEEVVKMLRK